MTHVTCRLTAKNRDQLQNPTLGNRVWATFTFFIPCPDKYQLSLIDPHDRIAAIQRRSSEVLSTQLTDDGPVYHARSVHLSRAKLITRFDDRYVVAKFSKSRVWNKSSRGQYPYFGGTRIFLQHTVVYAKNQFDSFSHFNATPTCDRQTDTHTHTHARTHARTHTHTHTGP